MGRIGQSSLVLMVSACVIAFTGMGISASAQKNTKGTPNQSEPTGLRVTDTKGNVITLHPVYGTLARIDYTVYNMIYTPDEENIGLRVQQGEGHVTVSWERLVRVEVTNTQTDVEAKIVTTTGETRTVVLVPWSKEGLKGETDLGSFSIFLGNVKTIEVIR